MYIVAVIHLTTRTCSDRLYTANKTRQAKGLKMKYRVVHWKANIKNKSSLKEGLIIPSKHLTDCIENTILLDKLQVKIVRSGEENLFLIDDNSFKQC